MSPEEIIQNIGKVEELTANAAQRAGRTPEDVSIIAVCKSRSLEEIAAAYRAGIRNFGENYIQEAKARAKQFPLNAPEVKVHFIGHLQSNKAREAAGHFHLIQSVDSFGLAAELSRRAVLLGIEIALLMEVKLDEASAKFGFLPESTEKEAERIMALPSLKLKGLMGMAPTVSRSEEARPHFRTLNRLFRLLPTESQETLSMGMTGDFETAVEEGATHIRIGTAIFGARTFQGGTSNS